MDVWKYGTYLQSVYAKYNYCQTSNLSFIYIWVINSFIAY